ncbi:GNAT family N-acetyltransferase [Gordonia sp. HNM0687]|uniref:GNAT family N-acetyltransferase n=1 Tax=Gordonia mangrovi TaxID=2665643 RepID=A0A6L7GRR7_9ACTN|nr:GNAT family N-acetyltransferase [Gordonia mangrovi]MXP21228.1 GNAT family N-acetyltransferase [Gordonia mangrovi]UVF78243.1 GNAT family N-acetyltransferase [Gordonia mangrovi]
MTLIQEPDDATTSSPLDVTPTNDHATVAALLTQAFADDPVMVWMQPDTRRQRVLWDIVVKYFHGAQSCFDLAVRDGRPVGTAAWDRPGHRTSARNQALSLVVMARRLGTRTHRGIALEHEFAKHRPSEPHWYLGQVGAAERGRGIGTALLESRLAQIDGPAYLESSNVRNIPLYERFGFEVTGEIALPFDGPQVWPMYRPA